MTTLAERVPLARIGQQARQAHPGRMLLTAIAAVLFGAGWLAFKTRAVVRLAAAWCSAAAIWCGAAAIEGWQSARAGREAP